MITNNKRELDILVATKVMGLEICICDHEDLRQKHLASQRPKNTYSRGSMSNHRTEYFPFGSNNNCNTCTKQYPGIVSYSTNIADAWKVIAKLRGDDWIVTIDLNNLESAVSLYRYRTGDGIALEDEEQSFEVLECTDICQAICLSALKTIEKGEKV